MKNITVYTIDELSADVQKKVVELNYDIELQDEWYQFIYENWNEQLTEKGYSDINIRFSGFGSQGEGASFTANVDVINFMKRYKLANKYRALFNAAKNGDAKIQIVRQRIYQYANPSTIYACEYCDHLTDKEQEQINEVLNLVTEEARSLSHAIHEDLQKEFDYLTSDERVMEALRRNKCYFSKTGKPINI